MKGKKATILTFAEKCKSILASNWQGYLNTIKADAKGSKDAIYTSRVKYVIKRGKPYIWVPEKELHNVNTVLDERGSFAVATPFPGPLTVLLKSMKKLPNRVALSGDVVPLRNEKVHSATRYLDEAVQSEQRAINDSTYTVHGVLNSSNHSSTSRSENLKELVGASENYIIYKFNPSSCMFIDSYGGTQEIDMEEIEQTKADPLAPLSAMLVDGINQSEARRRALILFCLYYLNINARDAYMLSVDRKGFDLLGKVTSGGRNDGTDEYRWREFRFKFKEEAHDVESFCRQLVEMEEEVVKKVSSESGLQWQ